MTEEEKLQIAEVVRTVVKGELAPIDYVQHSLTVDVRDRVLAHFKWLLGFASIPAVVLTWIGINSVNDIKALNKELRDEKKSLEEQLDAIQTKALNVDNELDRFQKESQDAYSNLNKLLMEEAERASAEAKFIEDSKKRRAEGRLGISSPN